MHKRAEPTFNTFLNVIHAILLLNKPSIAKCKPNFYKCIFCKGIAWIATICNEIYSSSFVEDRGVISLVAVTATHELGHRYDTIYIYLVALTATHKLGHMYDTIHV